MSKMKIYELAKELGVPNDQIVEFLQKKGEDVKSYRNSIGDAAVSMVRAAFQKASAGRKGKADAEAPKQEAPKSEAPKSEAPKPEAPKPEETKQKTEKSEAPKAEESKPEEPKPEASKKNVVRVFRPQNTQSGNRAGSRRAGGRDRQGRPGARYAQGKPVVANNGRPARTQQRVRPTRTSVEEAFAAALGIKPTEKPAQEPQEERIVRDHRIDHSTIPGTAEHARKLEQAHQMRRKEAEQTENAARAAKQEPSEKAERPARAEADAPRAQGERGRRAERGEGRKERGEQSRFGGRERGEQSRFGNRERGERGQGERGQRSDRRFGDRDRAQGGRGERGQGERGPRSDRRFGDRNAHGRDHGQGFGGHTDERRGARRNPVSAIPAPPVDNAQKPQRSKAKGKDDHRKKDYRGEQEGRMPKGRGRRSDIKTPLQKPQQKVQKVEEEIKSITIPEMLTIQELAEKMKIVPSQIIKKLFLQGKVVTVNQEIDYETAEEIALEYDILCEKEEVVDVIEELLKEEEEDEKKMKKRPPVVCVMGHVDHGKTSLLDAIRHTNVISGEAGGITQHIGASVVEVNGETITFLDTPGHEAFTAMRMRGANSTDIAILVVAADDGIMPQTIEAINHAKAAGVEIIVAINKIDKPSANVERVKQELTEYELIPEDWGGSTVVVPVSAKTREGLGDLMEMILLTAEVLELKANPNRRARGLVLEAKLDKGRGTVATVLVQKGTLRVGDVVAAGSAFGKVRAMTDDKGRRVKEAGPSMPVEILGLNDVPNAGEVLVGCKNEKEARSFSETFISQGRVKLLEETKQKLSLDDLFTQIQEGNLKELGIVVKADVQGSVEALKQSLVKLSNDEVVVKVIHGGVGAINESDVMLASASNAVIIGFNVRPDATAKNIAEQEGVDIRLYRVIYNAIEDVEAAMKGMLDPVYEEKVLGHAEVRQLFKASGVGTIAGAYVQDGVFERDCSARITRDGVVVYEGSLASLRRFKDDVKEVRAGYECGFVFNNFNDIKEGDIVESFKMVEIPR